MAFQHSATPYTGPGARCGVTALTRPMLSSPASASSATSSSTHCSSGTSGALLHSSSTSTRLSKECSVASRLGPRPGEVGMASTGMWAGSAGSSVCRAGATSQEASVTRKMSSASA